MLRRNLLSRKSASALSLAIFSSFGAAAALGATQNSTWTNGGGDFSWGNAANWTPVGAPNNGSGGFTDYNVAIGAPSPTNVIGAFAIDSMTLGTAGLVNIAGGSTLTLNGPTLTDNGTITIDSNTANAQAILNLNSVTVSGSGAIVLNDNGNPNIAVLNGVFTQGAGHTIGGHGNVNALITNNGTVNANTNGTNLFLLGNVTNNSLLEDTNGGALVIQGATVSQGAAGVIQANGGGTFGYVVLTGATVNGGTLTSAAGGIIYTNVGISTINGVTNTGTIDVQAGTTLNVTGNLTDNGTVNINSGAGNAATALTFGGGTLSGTGTFVLNDNGNANNAQLDGVLTQQAGHTINGHGNVNAVLTNNGTVNANTNGTNLFLLGNVTNNSLLEDTNGGALQIQGVTVNQGASGVIQANGGGTFGYVLLTGATVNGGTLTSAAGGIIYTGLGTSTINGVANTGTIDVQAGTGLNVTGNLTDNGTVNINSGAGNAQTILTFFSGTLGGSGTFVLNDNTNPNNARLDGTLTQLASHTISGHGEINALLFNNGTVIANPTNGSLNLFDRGPAVTNTGLMEATGGALLQFDSGIVINNTGGQIKALGGPVTFVNATLTGGTISSTGANVLAADGAVFNNNITIAPLSQLNIDGGNTLTVNSPTLTNNATITINAAATNAQTILSFSGGTLAGTGALVLNDNTNGNNARLDGSLTLASTQIIRGHGNINASLINNGIVNANVNGTVLNLNAAVTNNNLLEATGGATLNIAAVTVTQSASNVISAVGIPGTASVVNLSGTTVTGGILSDSAGGFIQAFSNATLVSLTNNATVDILGGNNVNVAGNLTDNGTVLINSGQVNAQTSLTFAGGTLAGTGAVILNDNTNGNNARLDGSLTQVSTHTIRGHGNINASLINRGTINADTAANTLRLDGLSVTNTGLMEATGGGTLLFNNGISVDNTGGQINGSGGPVDFIGMTLTGGTISATSPNVLTADGTTFNNNITIVTGTQLDIDGGQALTINSPTLTDNGTVLINAAQTNAQTSLTFAGGTLAGTGTVILNDNTNGNNARLDGSLTQGSTHTIRGHGNINAVLTNNGLVNSNVNGLNMNLNGNVTNTSLVEATGGATLSINSVTVTQTAPGVILAAGIAGTASVVNLSGATIVGGSLNASTGGFFQAFSNSTLTSLTNNAPIDLLGGHNLNVVGNLADNGTILINNSQANAQTSLTVAGGTVSGTGTFILNDNTNPNNARLDGTLTQSAGHTISGHGNINASLITNGTVNANVNGFNLNLNSNATNNGVIEASGGGALSINSITVTQGTSGLVTVGSSLAGITSFVSLVNSTVTGGSVTTASGGVLQFAGSFDSVPGTITSNGTVSAQAGSAAAPALVGQITGAGAIVVGSNGYLRIAGITAASTATSVTINSGTLDITNNKLVINYGAPGSDPVAAIAADLTAGRNGGPWNGTGITSSTAALKPTKFAVGYADGNTDPASDAAANQLVVKYTLAGDANLDNSVGFPDLLVVAQNYGSTGKDWAHGNFNYDPTGLVGFPDLLNVAQNYGFTTGINEGLTGGGFSPAFQLASSHVQSTLAVPEPSALALVAMASGMLARRRRRRA